MAMKILLLFMASTPSISLSWLSAIPPFQKRHSTQCYAMSSVQDTDCRVDRNMFYQYDKPILLIGCSGAGDELKRVAGALLREHSNANTGADGIVSLSEGNSILEAMKDKTLGWPQLILADFADKVFDASDSSQLQHRVTKAIQSLYNDYGILSIFVNVHPENSKMSKDAADRKMKLEENFFVTFSDYELCIRDEGISDSEDNWEHIEWEFIRLIARAKLIPAIPGDTTRSENTAQLTMGDHTFFLSLSFPEISQIEPNVEEMCQDVDAMEFRSDLLDCRDSRFDIIYSMQLLRRYCRPNVVRVPALNCGSIVMEDVMPIVYTVRTADQAGTYPTDDEGIEKMFDMLEWGLRAGSEVLDVECAWDDSKTDKLLSLAEKRYSSQILGSHHVVGEEVSTETAVNLFQQCALDGRAHATKVVLSISSKDKERMAYDAAAIASSLAKSNGDPEIPNISLILGEVGQFSRLLNFPFTPVTHESLPFKAAPGQLTASEIMTARLLTNILDKKVYGILGHNIAYSVSPQMHSGAFGATRLPHKYIRIDVPTVEEFVKGEFFLSKSFGGASVTIPHKQSIIKYVDVLSDAAKEIGSCNTLIATDEIDEKNNCIKRVIYGENTDWKGIFNPLNRLLGGRVDSTSDFALILGAGGTARAAAYVAERLGLRRLYYNRTPEKAIDLKEIFGGEVVSSLDEDGDEKSLGAILKSRQGASVKVVISTLPAAANFVLPDWVVACRPIIFDVNYKPYYTELLRQAEAADLPLVRGSEMLWEQGISQFELWTRRTAPYSVMKQIVLAKCLPEEVEGFQ